MTLDFHTGVFAGPWEMCILRSGEHLDNIYKCISCQTLSTHVAGPSLCEENRELVIHNEMQTI